MISKGTDTIVIEDVRRVTTDYEVANKYLGINSVPSNINSILSCFDIKKPNERKLIKEKNKALSSMDF